MSESTKVWLHTLGAAFISAFATSASGMVTLPTVFNFSHDGLINVLKVAALPAIAAVLAILKTSPLPPLVQTVVEKKQEVTDGTVTATATTTKITTGPA
jgi:hypothetical protein